MSKKFKNRIIIFSLILAIIGVASSFCSFLLVMPAEASMADMVADCQDKDMPMVAENSGSGTSMMVCCVDKNNNSSSDISNTGVKMSKLSVCQNISEENNLGNNFQNSQISLSSSNSPPGVALLTVSKKE